MTSASPEAARGDLAGWTQALDRMESELHGALAQADPVPWRPPIGLGPIPAELQERAARLIGRGPRFKQARARLYAKFPQYPREAAISSSDSVVVEVTPTHVFTWGLD